MTKLLAALALSSSLLAGCREQTPQVIAMPAAAATPAAPGQMTVVGSAKLDVSPDCADLTITLSSETGRPAAAGKDMDGKTKALVAALDKLGVGTTDIKMSTLSLQPVFAVNADGYPTSRIRGYRAELVVTATTKDFSKVPDMFEAAASVGASSVTSQFRRSDLAELKKKVRQMALAAAKEKAETTADTLGIKLGRVVSVVENQAGYMWSSTYFPSNYNAVDVQTNPGVALGGTLQPLTLDVTIGYELAREV